MDNYFPFLYPEAESEDTKKRKRESQEEKNND